MKIPRMVSPLTNPNGYIAAAGAVLAAATMIYHALNHQGVIDTTVIVSAVGAVGALFARNYVTPVRDPKDAGGNALLPAPAASAAGTIPSHAEGQ